MNLLEALKSEGNALFQQQRFVKAVQVYTSALEKLQSGGVVADAAERFETAVRLNRAWAWIQMPDDEAALAAETECSVVIQKDPSCVKALYRRALARERRGLWKLAMEDVDDIRRLEPGNPSIGPLLERLQQQSRDENLAPKLRHLSMNEAEEHYANTATSSIDLAREAEEEWRELQADEMNMQKVVHASTKSRRVTTKARKINKPPQTAKPVKGEISEKTDDLWASLRREEVTTVAKAFPRSRRARHAD